MAPRIPHEHRMLLKSIAAALLLLATVLAWANWPSARLPAGSRADRIVVEKAKRTLTLYRQGQVLKRYTVSLGLSPLGAKEREGDKKTPEGIYHLIEHKRDSDYHLALRVSYPGPQDVERARSLGVNAGFDIMVHGLPNGWGFIGRLHLLKDWTAGCVALTDPEIEEIFAATGNGTEIEIRR